MIRELLFDRREELARALASSVADSLYATLTAHPRASLVVSGGSTPRPFFEHLRDMELPWAKVTVTLADERWVPPDHQDSNEGMVRDLLLRGGAAAATFVGLWQPDATGPQQGCAQLSPRLARLLPFDVVVLGMGGDGHTASLFPHETHLESALGGEHLCVPSHPRDADHPRISLTPRALLDSRRLVLHITGENKRQVYEKARNPGPVADLPVRSILHQTTTDVDVYWAP